MGMFSGIIMKAADILCPPEGILRNTETNSPIMPYAGKKIKILIVDDDDDSIRRTISKYLIRFGFDVVEADNGHKGHYLFSNTSFCLVITDLEMPEIDGWTLAFNIKKEAPHTPVIMMTGMDEGVFIQNKRENCIDIVMFKPFGMKELKENIKRLLGRVY